MGEVRERLNHVMAGLTRSCRVQQRQRFAKPMFSRVTVDRNFRLRGWALSKSFSAASRIRPARFKTCFDGASPHASGALVPYERLRGWCPQPHKF